MSILLHLTVLTVLTVLTAWTAAAHPRTSLVRPDGCQRSAGQHPEPHHHSSGRPGHVRPLSSQGRLLHGCAARGGTRFPGLAAAGRRRNIHAEIRHLGTGIRHPPGPSWPSPPWTTAFTAPVPPCGRRPVPFIKGRTGTRAEKTYPEPFKYLGWCSWEQYKKNIFSPLLEQTARQLEESPVSVR